MQIRIGENSYAHLTSLLFWAYLENESFDQNPRLLEKTLWRFMQDAEPILSLKGKYKTWKKIPKQELFAQLNVFRKHLPVKVKAGSAKLKIAKYTVEKLYDIVVNGPLS